MTDAYDIRCPFLCTLTEYELNVNLVCRCQRRPLEAKALLKYELCTCLAPFGTWESIHMDYPGLLSIVTEVARNTTNHPMDRARPFFSRSQ